MEIIKMTSTTMKSTLFMLSAAALMFAADPGRTFTGVITDTMCGKEHAHMGVSPDPKCVKECMKMDKSVKYALFDGKNIYKLSDQKTPEQFAAQKVKVTGKLFDKTGIIQVEKIEAAK
jgi:hypothetical protein